MNRDAPFAPDVPQRALEAVKRPALRALHRSPAGEIFLVRTYLEAEERAEAAVFLDGVLEGAPAWLQAWAESHRQDELRHAALFRAHLVALAGEARAFGRLDPIGRWKLGRFEALADVFAPRFRHGRLVPVLATAWRLERTGARVFARHADELARTAPGHALLPLLSSVLADERRHAAACQRALQRLTSDGERADLAQLLFEVDRLDRRFGVVGAVVFWAIGVALWGAAALTRAGIRVVGRTRRSELEHPAAGGAGDDAVELRALCVPGAGSAAAATPSSVTGVSR